MAHVGWSADGTAAYLYDDQNNVTHRWIEGRPELSTFNPFTYGYGQGQAAQGGHYYDAWRDGGAGGGSASPGGGYYYPPERTELDLEFDKLDLDYADRQAAREENRYLFDRELDATIRQAQQAEAGATQRAEIAAAAGLEGDRIRAEADKERAQIAAANALQIAQMDIASRERIADQEFATRLKEMWSRERLTAAEIGAKPINYRVYERWLAGLGGQADPSGLPAGAPMFQTGPGMEGAVVPGQAPGPSPYAQAYATGQRIPEFQAYGRAPTAIGGEPWVDPHKVNVTQFLRSPKQSQEMQYGRWWEGGLMPNTAEQRMWAAAPTGTAGGVVGYG